MRGTISTSQVQSYLNKMDNVLYEIKDQKGILINNTYDAWKQEVLVDLANSGFIQGRGDKYVITEEGREVIKHDSFLYYNRRIKLKKDELPAENAPLTEPVSIFKSPYMIAIMLVIFLTALSTVLFK